MAIDLVLDGAETAAQPTALAPEVTTESVLAEVEQLTPEEQKQIEQFAGKIDIHKSEIVMNYGATIQKQSASIATKTLQDVKTKNTGEVSSLLIEMVGAMNGLSGGEDKGGFIQRFMQKVKQTFCQWFYKQSKRTVSLCKKSRERRLRLEPKTKAPKKPLNALKSSSKVIS